MRFISGRKPHAGFTGVDLGHAVIKVCGWGNRGPAIGMAATPPGVVRPEGLLVNEPLVQALGEAVAASGLKEIRAVTAVSGPGVFIRQLNLPPLPAPETAAAVHYEAERYLPSNAQQLVMEYLDLGLVELEGQSQQQVLLVAAPRELVLSYHRLFTQAGLRLWAVEVPALALWRSLVAARRPRPGVSQVLVNLGWLETEVALVRQERLRFCRQFGYGGASLAQAVAEAYGVGPEQGEDLLRQVDLEAADLDQGAVSARLALAELVQELRRSLDFIRLQMNGEPEPDVVLTGGLARLRGLAAYLAAELGVEVGARGPVFPASGEQDELEPQLAVAAGLALRGVVD